MMGQRWGHLLDPQKLLLFVCYQFPQNDDEKNLLIKENSVY